MFQLERNAADRVWPALLACRALLAAPEGATARSVAFVEKATGWQLAGEPHAASDLLLHLSGDAPESGGVAFSWPAYRAGDDPFDGRGDLLAAPIRAALRLYLPLLAGAWEARRSGNAFVTAHVAQTLDGRIACANGHSQWISNDANLCHAHRLRALHDAVLVGSGTVAADNPRLNVRHVSGTDPRRVVLSASGRVFDDPTRDVLRGTGSTVICRHGLVIPSSLREVDTLPLHADAEHRIAPAAIRDGLAGRGLHGVFLEGGSSTVSGFLQAGAIDVLHLHLAPMILGSGIGSFVMPEAQSVAEALRLRIERFDLDGELLLECRPTTAGC
ncbi:MAG: RibD family protein [Planctomycetes bacterium]|nr:RibD family protein [Planctomycetota bacterium]MCB9889256.1 RibD family protein [Planctomycetota bacterium]